MKNVVPDLYYIAKISDFDSSSLRGVEFRSFLALICPKSLCQSDKEASKKKNSLNRMIQNVTVTPLDTSSTSTNGSILHSGSQTPLVPSLKPTN